MPPGARRSLARVLLLLRDRALPRHARPRVGDRARELLVVLRAPAVAAALDVVAPAEVLHELRQLIDVGVVGVVLERLRELVESDLAADLLPDLRRRGLLVAD